MPGIPPRQGGGPDTSNEQLVLQSILKASLSEHRLNIRRVTTQDYDVRFSHGIDIIAPGDSYLVRDN